MHNAAQIKSLSCKSYSSFSVSDVTQSHPNSPSKKPPAHWICESFLHCYREKDNESKCDIKAESNIKANKMPKHLLNTLSHVTCSVVSNTAHKLYQHSWKACSEAVNPLFKAPGCVGPLPRLEARWRVHLQAASVLFYLLPGLQDHIAHQLEPDLG